MKRWLIPVAIVVVIVVGVVAAGCGGDGDAASAEEALQVLQNLPADQLQELRDSGALADLMGALVGRNAPGGAAGNAPGGAAGATRAAGGFTVGSIIAQDSDSITVQLADGSTKIVFYSGSTAIAVSKDGTAADLTDGQEVSVTGTSNSDGTITATRLQVGTVLQGLPGQNPKSTTTGQ